MNRFINGLRNLPYGSSPIGEDPLLTESQPMFNEGSVVFLKIAERSYKGIVQSFDSWRHLTLRLTKLDNSLVYKGTGEKVTITCINDEGIAFTGETSLMKKNLPTLVLHYPDNMEGKSIRKHDRIKVSVWTSIRDGKLGVKPEEAPILGDGTLVDLSPGGACVLTEIKGFNIGQGFVLDFQLNDDSSQVQLPCLVRNSRPGPYNCIYYGVEFISLPEGFRDQLEAFLAHPVS